MNKNLYIIVGGIILTCVAISFYAGMQFQLKNATVAKNQFTGRTGGRMMNATSGMPRGQRGGEAGFTSGEIVSGDGKSLSLKLPDGGSKVVFFGTETTIMRSVAGNTGDLSTGTYISISGSANPDGSLNAKSISVRTGEVRR